jgi:hypothetical protein
MGQKRTYAPQQIAYSIATREPRLRWSRGEASSPSPHFCRATSAALMPSSARPKVTPSSMMRRSFWVSAMRVYFVVSDGSLASPSAISRVRGSSLSAATISLTAPHSLAVWASSSWRVRMK